MSSRWWGVTSAVTSMPSPLAHRSTSTVPAVLAWATWTREPVCRASITSRATITSSATPGQPGSPSRPDSSPSWQQDVGPARSGSCACWLTTPPNALTYSSARRITRALATQRPSSENTVTRARERCIRPSSASSSPPSPRVTAPTGCTSTRPAWRPRSWTRSAASAVSVTGLVLAMARTAVNPPTAAACEPVSTVSASSRPGSRRWVCRSTRPGRATSPSASTTRAPLSVTLPISAITPSASSRSAAASPSRRAPLTMIRSFMMRSPRRRAGGRGSPSGPRPRPRPGRARPTGRRRPRRRRSRGRGSSGRGGRSGRRGPAAAAGRG